MRPFSPSPRLRIWAFRIAAVAIGLALSLLLVEMALRLFGLAPVGGIATVNQRDFDRLPGIYVPGQQMVDRRRPQLPHTITIDSLGYRGTEEFPRSKPVNEIRIVMLGDSFTYGDFVDDDKTLPAQLERIVKGRCGEGVRVINTGVGGTSIETASAMAERSLPLGVDIAVLTFTENDVTDLAVPMWNQMTANRAAKSRFPMSVVYPVMRRLAIWNVVLAAQGKWRNRRAGAVLARKPAPGPTEPSDALLALREEYRLRLDALRDRLSAEHVPLIFAIYPSHLSVYGINSGEQVSWVERTAREAGLPTVNLTEALRRDGRPMEALYLLPWDGHPSAVGYEVVAPVFADELLGVPPLAARCASQRQSEVGGNL